MNKIKINIVLFLGFIFFGVHVVFSQVSTTKIPLKDVLITLETQFNYHFNYANFLVEEINITPPKPDLSIEDTLDYLEQQTGLLFNLMSDNFIVIKKKNSFILCGYIKDKDTQEPLISATIQGRKNTAITNTEGYFEIELMSNQEEITIRYLGYKTLYRNYKYFNKNDCSSIYLMPLNEKLNQVILTNYIVKGISKVKSGKLEIDFSKFTILPGLIDTDVLHAIQAFPGIQSVNETVSNINIRGGSNDQNLILWDGIKMYQTGHFFGLISVFNPQITKKITVQKNGTNAAYTDGVSGTIHMHTGKSISTQYKANLGFNLIDANGFLDMPLGKKSSIQLAARKSVNDYLTSPTYNEYFKRITQNTEISNSGATVVNTDKKFDFYDASLRWLYRITDKDLVRLNFIFINNNLIFNENTILDEQAISRQSSISQNSIGAGFFYKRQWNENLKSQIQVYETDYALKAINVNLIDSQRFLQKNMVSETGIKINTSYSINSNYFWDIGYDFTETKVTNIDDVDEPLIRTLISEVVRTQSVYSQLFFKSNSNSTHLNVGVRYNYLNKFNKHIIEPRLSINQKIASYFNIEFLGEMKHQVTSQVINFQNDFLGIEKRRWQLANNEDIPIIKSKQASLSVDFNNRGWLLSAAYFLKYVDGITTQSQGFQNQYEFIKSKGNYQSNGLELLIRKKLKNTNVWLSYSYMNNDYTFEALPEKTFPSNYDISQNITFGTTYSFKKFLFSAGYNWRTGSPITKPYPDFPLLGELINYKNANSSHLPNYQRLDVSALYEFNIFKLKCKAGISIWNLLNKKNIVNTYYKINQQNQIEEIVQKPLGITPNASLRVYF